VIIKRDDGQLPGLSFGGADGQPPGWQDPERPRQAFLDIETDDLKAAEDLALRLGASRLTAAHSDQAVFADPEGHPFCLGPATP